MIEEFKLDMMKKKLDHLFLRLEEWRHIIVLLCVKTMKNVIIDFLINYMTVSHVFILFMLFNCKKVKSNVKSKSHFLLNLFKIYVRS